jgi:hypothetical protein
MAALNIKHRAIFYKLSSQGKIKVIYKWYLIKLKN